MNILENYNNAKQKYGIEIVELLTKQGLPPQYLLSACRFQTEYHMPTEQIVQLFKDWTRYVVRYSQIDVNTKNFDEFMQLITQGKREHLLPHILYKDEECILYSIDNIKDARNLPNDYCIKAVRKYNILKNDGYSFILIFLPNQQFPYTYVVASIHNGNVEYWDGQNYKLYNNEADSYRYEWYESLLPNQAKVIIHSTIANNQENINCNRNMNKTKIRLTESQLHKIINESVRNVLNERYGTPDRDTRDTIDFINHGSVDPNRDTRTYETYDTILKVRSLAVESLYFLRGLENALDKNYLSSLKSHLTQVEKLCDRLRQHEIMKQGEQPDEFYDSTHTKRHNRGGWGSGEIFELDR